MFKVTARDQGHYKGPSGAFVTYCNISCFAHVEHFHLTPVNRNFRLVTINFTDKIWLVSIMLGHTYVKLRILTPSPLKVKTFYIHFSVIFGENYYDFTCTCIVFHMYHNCHHVERMFWFAGPIAYWT